MGRRMTRRQQAIRRRNIFLGSCAGALAALMFLIAIGISSCSKNADKKPNNVQNTVSAPSKDEPVHEVASATVLNTGDILIHNPVLWGAEQSDGSYDFTSMFSETASWFKKADLSVINLEVTLGGNDGRSYTGYPAFNTPDCLIDTLKDQGIGLFLTANNHCYDTRLAGMIRTTQVLKQKGMPFIGTRETDTDPTFIVKDVNGVNIGMACYTYETPTPNGAAANPNNKYLNGNAVASEGTALVNSFSYEHIDDFYAEAEQTIAQMKAQNADAIVFYLHWGVEYRLSPNDWQKTIAQKLCDLGVDVIVGGHPHVVEPMELLHASGSDHTTVCLYSMGNAVSNQRRDQMTGCCETGHTEDGVLFYYTFKKYSDGTTVLSGVDVIPTWVGMEKIGHKNGIYTARYTVYPLESRDYGAMNFGLSGSVATSAQNSYDRTKALLQEGLTECQEYLKCNVRWPEDTP